MQLTPNFHLKEFACGCGCGIENDPKVMPKLKRLCQFILEPLRKKCGNRKMTITSGVRCAAYNARPEVGGAKGSRHLPGYADAADVKVEGMSAKEVQAIARDLPQVGGLGLGETFTHVDNRGHRAEWTY